MKNHRDEVCWSTQPLGTSTPASAPRHGPKLKTAMALGTAGATATLALFLYLEVLLPAQLARLPAPR